MEKFILLIIFVLLFLEVETQCTNQHYQLPLQKCPTLRTYSGKCYNVSSQNCYCSSLYEDSLAGCKLNCSNFKNSTGVTNSSDECGCQKNYMWTFYPIFGCVADCSTIPNASKQSGEGCECQIGYHYNSRQNSCHKNITIDLGLALGLSFGLAIPLLICVVYCYYRKRYLTNQQQNNPDTESNTPIGSSTNLKMNIDQQHNSHERPFQKKDNCPVCLSDQVNSILSCGHSFHLTCIMNWLNRKKVCPTCRNLRVNEIKLFCSKCCLKFLKLYPITNKNLKEITKLIGEKECSACEIKFKIN